MLEDIHVRVEPVGGLEGRIEQDVGHGRGVDAWRIGRIVQPWIQVREHGHVRPGRPAARDDARRINPQFAGMLPEPAKRALGIRDAHAFA